MKRFSRALVSLSVSLALSELGSGISRVAIILFVYARTGRAADLAILFAIDVAATLLVTPFAGVAIDRLGPRRTMIAADLLRFVAILSALAVRDLWLIYAIAAALSAGNAFFGPARNTLAPRLVADSELSEANAALGGLSTLSYLLGNGIGAFVIQGSSIAAAFVLDAATYMVSACALLALPVRPVAFAGNASWIASLSEFAAGGDILVRSGAVVVCLGIFVIETFVNAIYPLFPLFNTQSLGNNVGLVGYIAVAFGVGGLFGLSAVGRLDRLVSDGRLYIISGFMGGLLMVAFALAPDSASLLAVCVVWGAFYVLSEVSSITTLQRRIPETLHGRAFASLRVLQKFAVLMSSAIVWTFGDRYRAGAIFMACGFAYSVLWIALSLTRGARVLVLKSE